MITKPNKSVIFATDLYWSPDGHSTVSCNSTNQGIAISPLANTHCEDTEWGAEQLFLSAITTSLLRTYLELSSRLKVNNAGFECTATGQAEITDGGMKFTFIHVYPKAWVNNESDIELALIALAKARKICPIYNSINAEIIQHPEVVTAKKKNEAA